MAYMYPSKMMISNSNAEKTIFKIFEKFSNSFHIIHSYPWLSTHIAKKIKRFNPEGEIDFILLHEDFGILCLEIKGGRVSFNKHGYFTNGYSMKKNPYIQASGHSHALRESIAEITKNITVGYIIGFPDVVIPKMNLDAPDITFDESDLINLEKRIIDMFHYWNKAIKKNCPNANDIQNILKKLLPSSNNQLNDKINYDNKHWLTLSTEQTNILDNALNFNRHFISGRAGTGKTVLAIMLSRILLVKNKRILFLSFNKGISVQIQKEFIDANISVSTFHQFLRDNNPFSEIKDSVNNEIKIMEKLVEFNNNEYDVLIIDEAQSFVARWLVELDKYFHKKKIYIFSDELQAFAHEGKVSNQAMNAIFKFEGEMFLSYNYRSPYKVYKRLLELFSSSIEQVSKRDKDLLDLEEIITDKPKKTLEDTIDTLLNQNIDKDNIVVLVSSFQRKYLDMFRYKNIEVDTVQKFRGMEKPIVIYILTSLDKKDFKELYVAYSRATTQTIVIIPEDFLSLGKSHFEKILLDSDITNIDFKNTLNTKIREFGKKITKDYSIFKAYNFSFYFSEKTILLPSKNHKFINRLLVDYFTSNNITTIVITPNNPKVARLNSSILCDTDDFHHGYCSSCQKDGYMSIINESIVCINCNINQLNNIDEVILRQDFNVLLNPKANKDESLLLHDSLKTIGRYYNSKLNENLTQKTLIMLSKKDIIYISCIIEILIILYSYKEKVISIEKIRDSEKFRKLNGITSENIKQKFGVCPNMLKNEGLFEIIKKGLYKIRKEEIFLELGLLK